MIRRACFYFLFMVSVFLQAQTYDAQLKEAQTQYEKGNFRKAFEITSQITNEASKNKNVSADELVSIKSENATYMAFTNEFDKSMAIFDALLAELSKVKPETKIHVKKNYGTALCFFGYYRDAVVQFEDAYKLLASNEIEKNEHLSVLSSLGQCYQFLYDFKASEKFFKEAIAYSEKNGMSKTFDHAVLHSNLGLLYKDMLLEIRSMETYAIAEKLFASQTDTMNIDFADFLLNYGSSLGENGQLEKGLSKLIRTRNIHRILFGERSPEYAIVLNNFGYVFSKNYKLIETEQYYTQSIELKKKIPGVKILSYLNTQNNLMVFYSNAGRNDEAKEMMAEVERGLKDPNLDDTLSRAAFANNLGLEYRNLKQREKALKFYREAIYYYDRIYGKGNELSGDIYLSMSFVSLDADDYEHVNEYMQLALQSSTTALAKGDANAIFLLCNMVSICNAINTPSLGLQLIDQAIELVKLNGLSDPELIETVYITKAHNAGELNDTKTSVEYFNKYLDIKYVQMEDRFRLNIFNI